MNSSFKDKIEKIVKDNVERFKSKTENKNHYKDFSSSINAEVNSIVGDVLGEVYRNYRPEDYETKELFVEDVLNKCSILMTQRTHNSGRFSGLINSYQLKHKQHEILTDEIKQAVRHDWHDKLRFLLFRTLTAAGVAGAAVGMAMFAHNLGYETALIKKKKTEQKMTEVIKSIETTQTLPIKSKTITQKIPAKSEMKDSKQCVNAALG